MIIVSLTSLPDRLTKINPVIENLCTQSFKPDKIVLWLPKQSKRMGKEYVIPDILKELTIKYDHFEIEIVDKDWGPSTKLIPAIQKYCDHTIITVDDDVILKPNHFETLVNYNKKYPKFVLCFVSAYGNHKFMHPQWIKDRDIYPAYVIGGYKGVLYPANTFSKDYIEIFKEVESIHENGLVRNDDYFVTSYFEMKGVEKYVCAAQEDVVDFSKSPKFEDALNNENTYTLTENSMKIIIEYFREKFNIEMKIVN
jgi:hypothetical protein